MTTAPRVCVLIPAYNESKNIGRVIRSVMDRGYPVLAVDDGSSDNTAGEIRSTGAHALILKINQGKGAAIRRGLAWVLENGFDGVIIVDADGQHDPDELALFYNALTSGAGDVIVGNRMTDPKDMPRIRRWTNRFMSWTVSRVAGQNIPDTQCGYRALSRKAIMSIELRTDRFEIESEMLMAAGKKGLKISSVPVSSVYGDEVSHIRPMRDTVRFFSFLFRFIASHRR